MDFSGRYSIGCITIQTVRSGDPIDWAQNSHTGFSGTEQDIPAPLGDFQRQVAPLSVEHAEVVCLQLDDKGFGLRRVLFQVLADRGQHELAGGKRDVAYAIEQ